MTAQFTEAFNDLIREKRIDKKLLMETLEAGFTSAVRKKLGATAEVEVAEDGRGGIELYLVKSVVDEVESPASEISVEEAMEIDEEIKAGDQVKIYMPFAEFGRNAIQIAKQILTQKLREFERDRTFEEYKNRVGDIVSGSVQQIDRNGILVNLGNAEATMPKKEQIRRERYSQGSSIRACIIKVDKEAKGSMITVSRTSPEFLKKLFAQEVPEIYEGIIEVKSVAREAGGRSKIAVYSRDDRVDAVGACVGMKGSRVQAVVNELSGERIDIVPWNDDISAFVSRALSPAKISSVRADSENRRVLVVVEEDQLSLAIGKEGQNVRLASRLTGWQIDLTTTRELEQRERLQEHLTMSIEEMVGVTPRIAEKLKSIGVSTVQKLAKVSDEALLELPGLGPKTVEKLKETAAGTIKELEKAMLELMDKENEERRKAKEEEKPLFDEAIHGPEESRKERRGKLTEAALFAEAAPEEAEAEEAEAEADTEPAAEEEGEAPRGADESVSGAEDEGSESAADQSTSDVEGGGPEEESGETESEEPKDRTLEE